LKPPNKKMSFTELVQSRASKEEPTQGKLTSKWGSEVSRDFSFLYKASQQLGRNLDGFFTAVFSEEMGETPFIEVEANLNKLLCDHFRVIWKHWNKLGPVLEQEGLQGAYIGHLLSGIGYPLRMAFWRAMKSFSFEKRRKKAFITLFLGVADRLIEASVQFESKPNSLLGFKTTSNTIILGLLVDTETWLENIPSIFSPDLPIVLARLMIGKENEEEDEITLEKVLELYYLYTVSQENSIMRWRNSQREDAGISLMNQLGRVRDLNRTPPPSAVSRRKRGRADLSIFN